MNRNNSAYALPLSGKDVRGSASSWLPPHEKLDSSYVGQVFQLVTWILAETLTQQQNKQNQIFHNPNLNYNHITSQPQPQTQTQEQQQRKPNGQNIEKLKRNKTTDSASSCLMNGKRLARDLYAA
jgi:hypothetical protein